MIKRLWKQRKAKREQMTDNKKLILDYNIPNPAKEINEKIYKGESMKLRGKEIIRLEDGLYNGTIMDIGEARDVEFTDGKTAQYIDIEIDEEKTGVSLKAGVTTSVTEMSKLGMILVNFLGEIKNWDIEFDLDKILKGKKCQFMVMTQKKERGNFPKILPESIKPRK